MSGIAPADLRALVIRPALAALELGGDAAEELLLGTAAQESGCGRRLAQQGGPALGVWQIEPATHDDLWNNFLRYRAALAAKLDGLRAAALPASAQLAGNLPYGCAIARLIYLRVPAALPAAGDLAGQAAFYKAHYNTGAGAATLAEYLDNARAAGLAG